MGFLLIDKRKVNSLIENARKNIIEVNPTNINTLKPITDDPTFCGEFGSYRVVFSFEKQPSGFFRHLSVSNLLSNEELPGDFAILQIMKIFEFENIDLDQTDTKRLWIEQNHSVFNGSKSINVIEKISGEKF